MLKQVVILVGGRGTRLGNLTSDTPKPLLPVAGRPFLDYLIAHFVRHGLSKILLLAGHNGQKIREQYLNDSVPGATIEVTVEPEALGTAGCLKFAEDQLDDLFLVANGDSLFDFNVLALLDNAAQNNCLAKLALRRTNDTNRFGQVKLNSQGRITEFAEKAATKNEAALINGGLYLMDKRVVDFVKDSPCSLEKEIFPCLLKAGSLSGQEYYGYFIDIGVPESYKRSQWEIPANLKRPAIFFDRDGTLNHDTGYTHRTNDLKWIPGAREAIRLCNDRGYYVFVVTNQAGVARGYYDEAAVNRFHEHMQQQLQTYGGHIDAFEYCPHHVDGTDHKYSISCTCRKPKTGMLEKLAFNWQIDIKNSLFIGDQDKDIECATQFGVDSRRYTQGSLLELVQEALAN